jgi:hypothetical protein
MCSSIVDNRTGSPTLGRNGLINATVVGVIHQGVAQAGSATSITLASAASSTNGTYDPAIVRLVSGTGAGQSRLIVDYVGSTRVATVDRNWRTNPDSTTGYDILSAPNTVSRNEGLAAGGTATSITLNSAASSVNDTYVGQTVWLIAGTGQDQSRIITAYNGTTKVATVATAWATTPDTSSVYFMLPHGRADVVTVTASAVTEIWSKAMSELSSVPGVTGTTLEALQFLFLLARNKVTQTSTTQTLRNDADSASIGTAAVADDGTTFTRSEWA